ncbi:MAG: AMP-binding protein [candidate division Zixibacteria bacterium]|nr:AMP-binding protein [candidate division Zixibacteria bacterium]
MGIGFSSNISIDDNLCRSFFLSAMKFGDKVAYKADGGTGRSCSYRDALDIVSRFGAGLKAKCKSETEIGLLSENRPEWPISYLSILNSGKTVVPIDANLKPAEKKNIIDSARLKTVIVSDSQKDTISDISSDLKLILISEDSENSWHNYFQSPTKQIEISSDKTAALIYTSGTTGNPKAVMLTHSNLLHNLNSIGSCFQFSETDIFLSVLPLHHTLECTCGFLTPFSCGAQVVFARSLKSKEIVEDIKRSQATIMIAVPLLFEKMYDSISRKIKTAPLVRRILFKILFSLSWLGWKFGLRLGHSLFKSMRERAGLSSIRIFVSGGAPLPKKIAVFFNLIGFTFLEGYGLTETSPVLTANRLDDIKFGSVGRAVPGVEVKINKPDKNGIGEIIARGGNITPGYKDNPQATAELIRDGWLYTGDLGKLENGYLYITGRAKNLIVSAAGKNIYPEEIEEHLFASPYILEAVVFGRKKQNKQGEDVLAVIVPDLDQIALDFSTVSADSPDMTALKKVMDKIVSEINSSMSGYKRINSFEIQLEELEKTSTKKVKRFVYG